MNSHYNNYWPEGNFEPKNGQKGVEPGATLQPDGRFSPQEKKMIDRLNQIDAMKQEELSNKLAEEANEIRIKLAALGIYK